MKKRVLVLLSLIGISNWAFGNELVIKPFHDSVLTDVQLEAWDYYLEEESGRFGCHYGDDERLSSSPKELLTSLSQGEDIAPVQVTLRTYLSLGENVKQLLRRNMYIASMDCNPVYVFGNEFIGRPVLPFEEYTDILFSKLKNNPDLSKHLHFIRENSVAAIDARWFWAFFLINEDYYRLLGYDYEAVKGLVDMLPGERGEVTPKTALWHLYNEAFNHGIYLHCEPTKENIHSGPNTDVVVDNTLESGDISDFYRNKTDIPVYYITSKFSVDKTEPLSNPSNPYFNVTRTVILEGKGCML